VPELRDRVTDAIEAELASGAELDPVSSS
jgi:hypothetical protein